MTTAREPVWTPLEPGDVVGGYRVERLLGPRGMSHVYEARDAEGGLVMLKLIRPELAADLAFRRRFLRQVRAAASVEHPNLISILDSGEHDGVPYLATVHVPGMALDARIRRDGPLEVGQAVRVLLEVAGALDAMHRAGLVHREVNSGGMLIADDGTAYISELGLAKMPNASVLTRPGQALGATHSIAPEQIRGEEVTRAADIYGLGCVTYEALCGAPPFADRLGMRILWAHLQDEPPPPSERRPDVSPELGWAVLRALEKDPSRRPPSATAYARMIQLAADATTA